MPGAGAQGRVRPALTSCRTAKALRLQAGPLPSSSVCLSPPPMSLQDPRLAARALSEPRTPSSSPDPEPRLQRAVFQEGTRGQGKDVSLGITIQPTSSIKPGPHTPPRACSRGCGPHTWGGQGRTQRPEPPAPTKGAQVKETLHTEAWPAQQTRLLCKVVCLPDGPCDRAGHLGSQAPHLRPGFRPAYLTNVHKPPALPS